jgi:hypothetical protein
MDELTETRRAFIASLQQAVRGLQAPREVVKERQKALLSDELFHMIDGFLDSCELGRKDISEVLDRVGSRVKDML